MFGQGLPRRFRTGPEVRRSFRSKLVGIGGQPFLRLQLFQLELQLFDLPLQLLRLATELHAPQLGNQQLQMFDLTLMGEQLLMLRNDQRLQSRWIQQLQVRQCYRRSSHRRSMPATRYNANSAGTQKSVQIIQGELRSPTAVLQYVQAVANRCLPAASITALASAPPCHHWLVATHNVLAPAASQTSRVHRRPTKAL